mmetsp:Transcript_27300/g.48258  ORF Transcript_27300/g.48258 Transcript_27300/m.48258 type:complete len:214 (+) Transcript_27300:127-768(+)|eukprot:CAMPEP_0197527178 /NCGR_PEP_ID=MMETSP1318-20131121/20592_1 /TAXON_ID=552666 /ORGANISM="Partenskyella glossopodia, Strain RCC365" /LENGTH=213 /DNA_ID=CAMNT_0043081685 /DNA_START=92 /DNA_END=733 /DNA_ORIENTATION=+
MPKFGKAPKCPRCAKTVYFAEQKMVLGKAWHKPCFTCKECKRSLDSGFSEHDKEVYCKRCYGKLFGPKGYGFGGGAGVLSSEKGDDGKAQVTKITKGLQKTTISPRANSPAKPQSSSGAILGPCAKCGADLKVGSKFCTNCGAKAEVKKAPPPASAGPQCSKCGAPGKEGQKFCTECGGKMAAAKPAEPQCPNCSVKVKAGQKFCTECGFKLC